MTHLTGETIERLGIQKSTHLENGTLTDMSQAIKLPTTSQTVQLGAKGRLVIPSRARRELGLEQGSRLVLTVEGPGVLKLTSAEVAAAECEGLLADLGTDRSLAEELIAERHEAALRE